MTAKSIAGECFPFPARNVCMLHGDRRATKTFVMFLGSLCVRTSYP